MRLNGSKLRNRGGRVVFVIVTFCLMLFGWFVVQRFLLQRPKLVSIQEISDMGESCAYPEGQMASARNLFSEFERTANAQDANTVELNRPPVRDILDTAPRV